MASKYVTTLRARLFTLVCSAVRSALVFPVSSASVSGGMLSLAPPAFLLRWVWLVFQVNY